MTIAGYILMTVLTKSSLFENPTTSTTQVLLPPTVDCEKAASSMKKSQIVTEVYCIPIYEK